MAPRFPSIPEPGSDPATQLNTLRIIKQVVELLAANATGDKNPSGPGQGAQIFALQEDVKRLMQLEAASRAQADDKNKEDITWTVDEAVADLNKDISDARNRAIQARADALQALDVFEQQVAQTVYEFNQELGDVKSSVTEEAGARATADDAMSGRISKAASYVGLNEATWKQGDISVATRFSAMSAGYADYVARTGDNFLGSYTQHIVTTSTFNDAVATKVNNLETKITVPTTPGRPQLYLSSAILSESNSVSDATKKIATAQDINTTVASLSSPTGAITAAVKVESDARVKLVNDSGTGTVDTKLKNVVSTAQYSVAVTTTGPAGPAITGFRAVSDSSSYTPISDFQIFANNFRVTNGSTTKTPFSIDAVNSKINMSADVAIDGNLMVTGSIKARGIGTGEISDNRGYTAVNYNSAPIEGMYLNAGDKVSIMGTGGGGGGQAGGFGTLTVYWSGPNGSGIVGNSQGSIALVNSGNVANVFGTLLFQGSYMYPPASILRTFTATASGNHAFSVYNLLGGDTSIVVIRLSR